MSMSGIELAVQKIADDLLALTALVLDSDTVGSNAKVGRNTLRDSALKGDLEVAVNNNGDPVISALFNNYIVYLEAGRSPKQGKRPPISALKGWAAQNNIPTDASTLWAISTAIWRDGYQGRPILATIDQKLDSLFMDKWSDQLFNAIVINLDNFFND